MSRPSSTIFSGADSGHSSRIVSLKTPQVRMSRPRSRHFAASALAPAASGLLPPRSVTSSKAIIAQPADFAHRHSLALCLPRLEPFHDGFSLLGGLLDQSFFLE